MNTPPPPNVIATLVSRNIELISFGKYIAHLTLDNEDRISIACPFRFDLSASIMDAPVQEFPLSSSTLLRIIGISIEHAECESDGTLQIRFNNGDSLIAYANDPNYEAYTLLINRVEYVV